MKQVVLIDGNSLLFRAFFAMRPMITSSGVQTQGIFAFINMLNKIIRDYKPDYLAVAFDMKEKTFRHERFSEYKAGRQQTPIELLTEIPLLHRVLEAMNIAIIEKPRYEADDIIGTISARADAEGLRTLIISGDKDGLQLISPNVNVLINRKGMTEFDLYDEDAMKARYGLTPAQFLDLKALMGDKSDNIPGIQGVGEKKGIALLEKYGTLEGVIEHAGEIPGKLGENVRAGIESARLSKWLAAINIESPIDFDWEDLEYRKPDYDRLIEIYTELEFNSFIMKLRAEMNAADASGGEASYDVGSLAAASPDASSVERVTIEEFLSRIPEGSRVIIEASANADHLAQPEISCYGLLSPDEGIAAIRSVTPLEAGLYAEKIAGMGYLLQGCGLKRIIYSMLGYGIHGLIPDYDAAVAEYLLDPNRQKYSLTKMLLRYPGTAAGADEASFLDDKTDEDSYALTEEQILRRMVCIWSVIPAQREALEREGLADLFSRCEMPLVLTLARMELQGIRCDRDILASIGQELTARIDELAGSIWEEAGREFNINSPKQLGSVLFEELAIPYPKTGGKGRSGGYSTAADILDKLKEDHNIVRDVLEYRKVTKLKGTYVDGLIPLIGYDGRIRPHFMQTVAATGRLSCTEPNLQNIPVRDDYGRLIRMAFVAGEGNVFTGSDYSQIELRILAALSGDKALIDDFRQGKDIHRATAARVFELSEDEVTPLDRTRAKAVNFGVVYGMSGFGLSESLHISRAEGQRYINDYFAKHKAVKRYLDEQIEVGEKNMAVRTYYGRIRQIPEFGSRKFMEKELARRLAMNTPIQGTAADIIKIAMNAVSQELIERGLRSRLILQIHDELIVEGPESELEEVKTVLDDMMRGAAKLAVELTVDIHSGSTWYELK